MYPNRLNHCNEIEKRRKTGRTYLHNHLDSGSSNMSQTVFQNNIQNIPLLPRSVRASRPGVSSFASARTRWWFSQAKLRQVRRYTKVARPFSSSRRSPVYWKPVALAAYIWGDSGQAKQVFEDVFLVAVGPGSASPEIDGGLISTTK